MRAIETDRLVIRPFVPGDLECIHEIIADRVRFDAARPADNQGNVNPRVVAPSLASRKAASVIAPEEDYRAVGKAVGLQPLQNLSRLFVHRRNVVVVSRQVLPDDWRIRIERRHGHFGRIVNNLLVLLGPVPRLMADGKVYHAKERHIPRPVAPVPALVPGGKRRLELIIRLRVIRAEITGRPQVLAEALHVRRRNRLISPEIRPHVHAAYRARVHTGDDRATRRGADGIRHKGVGISTAL